MGIDVRYIVRLPAGLHLGDDEIGAIGRDIEPLLGNDYWRIRPWDHEYSIGTGETQPGEQLLVVDTLTRYYGKGYSRGPWPTIRKVIEYLVRRFPDGEVFYGSDSDTATIVTDEFLADTDAWWGEHGTRPYHSLRGALATHPVPC